MLSIDKVDGFSSDYNATMATDVKFDALLSTVQSSNLNFHIEISPFSAVIHLKKSLIVIKLGISQLPPQENSRKLNANWTTETLQFRSCQENQIPWNAESLIKSDYENALLDCQEAHKTISKLKEDLEYAWAVKENKDKTASKIKSKAMDVGLSDKSKQL